MMHTLKSEVIKNELEILKTNKFKDMSMKSITSHVVYYCISAFVSVICI
jgi:hypothetical protein